MQNKTFKIKDMMIAVFCTILAILAIVFYFLPAFNIQHTASIGVDYETVNFSAFNMTQATFTNEKVLGSDLLTLLELKDAYGMPIFLAGILSICAIICIILTTAFAYLSWFLYPLLLAYPLLKLEIWSSQSKKLAIFMLGNILFTYLMFLMGK